MSSLFNGQNSGDEDELKINTGYANNYNSWRQKEEFSKLKTRYGEHVKNSEDDSETSSDEDEEGAELTEQMEKDFYKMLACLKNKDPKIYDDSVKFFDKTINEDEAPELEGTSKKSKKEKKLFLRDYERQIVMERGGKFSDSEDEDTFHRKSRETRAPTYVEEQRALKESISKALDDDDDDENEETGLLKPKAKTAVEKLKDEETYKEWLKGQSTEIDNGEKEALKPLRDCWTDPNIDPKEKFLRDYVLNKKFLGKDGEEDYLEYDQMVHDSDENLSEDEKNIEKQEEFEHKYNFRFEDPDQEFLKRYPRTLEDSLRKKDNRRSQKRAEVKQRKEDDKVRKQEELKQLKAMKRKEIEEKIEKLKEITGNDDIRLDNIDLDGEFDPAEHDRKMQELFNEEYYNGEEGDMKPEFPDIDEELGIDKKWDDYDPINDVFVPDAEDTRAANPDCEDPEFNMDADYDPTKSFQTELIDSSRKKKKRRRSKFAEVLAKEKPKFDPNVHSSYRDYIEQYYALDYEDMIDDLPCRFKYRKVVPNDFGLSVEEILMADDRELNKWCSLKRALEHKPEEAEMRDVLRYKQKAENETFKKMILKSLYTTEKEAQDPETAITPLNQQNGQPEKKKRKAKKKKSSGANPDAPKLEETKSSESNSNDANFADNKISKGKKQKKPKLSADAPPVDDRIEEAMIAVPELPTQKGKKRKADKTAMETPQSNQRETEEPHVKKSKQEVPQSKKSKQEVPQSKESKQKVPQSKKSKPQTKKSETETAPLSENTEDSKISRKKLKKDKQKEKQFNRREAEKSINASKNTKASTGEKINKKNKKQSAGAPGTKKKFNNKNSKKETDQVALLSSERLKAYGLNPKKFKNKLKYGKQN